MIIIGGGVIGVEMASVYARIGTKVTILEYAGNLIPTMDQELGKSLQKSLATLSIDIRLNCQVQSAVNTSSAAAVGYLDKDGQQQAAVGMAHETTAGEMFRICYAHPTYSEALKDAFLLGAGKSAINI